MRDSFHVLPVSSLVNASKYSHPSLRSFGTLKYEKLGSVSSEEEVGIVVVEAHMTSDHDHLFQELELLSFRTFRVARPSFVDWHVAFLSQ